MEKGAVTPFYFLCLKSNKTNINSVIHQHFQRAAFVQEKDQEQHVYRDPRTRVSKRLTQLSGGAPVVIAGTGRSPGILCQVF